MAGHRLVARDASTSAPPDVEAAAGQDRQVDLDVIWAGS